MPCHGPNRFRDICKQVKAAIFSQSSTTQCVHIECQMSDNLTRLRVMVVLYIMMYLDWQRAKARLQGH